ncbi:ferritin-like domain-containing protein [Nocardioides sp. 616]|uniref:ferritin-like domain-containing protein n=1 Tax=Nocardioides sp. 616 TaxID=2268090 RepID=UPI000CE55F32|nr:ferritin-like domain-containing protein [Nocardioides sp. 616]
MTTADTSGTTSSALQAVLSLEHAAVQLYGLLGGQTSLTAEPARHGLITARYAVHRERRDDVVSALRRRGVEPTPAASAYHLPTLGSPASVAAAALEIEQECAGAYAQLVSQSEGRLRRWAISALGETALAELAWGARPTSFPGADEL